MRPSGAFVTTQRRLETEVPSQSLALSFRPQFPLCQREIANLIILSSEL